MYLIPAWSTDPDDLSKEFFSMDNGLGGCMSLVTLIPSTKGEARLRGEFVSLGGHLHTGIFLLVCFALK